MVDETARQAADRGAIGRAELRRFVQLFAVCGFVFARPVLGSFGAAPETFLSADATGFDIVVFAAAWILIPPLAFTAVGFAIRAIRRVWLPNVHAGTIGVLVACTIAQEFTQSQTWLRPVIWVGAGVVGLALAFLVARSATVQSYLMLLSVAPIVFATLFLASSATGDLLSDSNVSNVSNVSIRDAASATPIVMIVFDEFPTASLLGPSGAIDPLVFPGFARLAGMSTWYRNDTTVAPTTGRAVPALLSGLMPGVDPPAPIAAEFPDNLFTVLGNSHEMNVVEPITALCPRRYCGGGASGGISRLIRRSARFWVDRFHRAPPGSETFFDITAEADQRVGQFAAFIDSVGSTGAPRLDFAHVLLPHGPWRFLPSGKKYDASGDMGVGPFSYAWLDDGAARFARTRHLLQLQYVDRQIGRMLDRLEDLEVLDKTLLVVTADHGVAFRGEDFVRAMSDGNRTEIAATPLFIKAPGQSRGLVDDRNAQSIDVFPTIVDLVDLDVAIDSEFDGASLLGTPRGPLKQIKAVDQTEAATDNGFVELDANDELRALLDGPPAYTGHDEYAVFRRGPEDRFVGQAVSDLVSGPSAPGQATFDSPSLTVETNAAAMLPVVKATTTVSEGTDVALAVNGTIIGAYRVGVDSRVRYIVPEAVLHPGRNDRALYVVEPTDDGVELLPITETDL